MPQWKITHSGRRGRRGSTGRHRVQYVPVWTRRCLPSGGGRRGESRLALRFRVYVGVGSESVSFAHQSYLPKLLSSTGLSTVPTRFLGTRDRSTVHVTGRQRFVGSTGVL